MTENEAELIKRAQARDTDAFCKLAALYERRIYSLALHYCHDPQDAEDLSQEVWLKVYQAIGSFRHESTFYTWIRRITIKLLSQPAAHDLLSVGKNDWSVD